MSRLNEIIEQLKDVANHPTKAATDYKKAGKKVVGIMPVYAPEELVHAAGAIPMGIWGGRKKIAKARTYLPPFGCSIMQTILESQIEGDYDMLDAVMFSVPCDTLKCLSQKWKGSSPVIVFTHPQNRAIEAANAFLMEEYKIVRAKLESLLGVKITDEAIQKSIEVYNKNRAAMRKFTEAAGQYPDLIDPIARHAVIKARWFMEKSAHTALVEELLAELNKEPKTAWKGKKVILTGIMAEPDELLNLFKKHNLAIVGDDLAHESRQFRHDVPVEKDPLLGLAKWWRELEGCALATDTKKLRGAMLIDMHKKLGADAIIECMMKFCDPEEFDYPIYIQEFDAAGIPHIMVEVDLEMTAFEQTNTRLQSFVEIL